MAAEREAVTTGKREARRSHHAGGRECVARILECGDGDAGPGCCDRAFDQARWDRLRQPEPERDSVLITCDLPGELRLTLEQPPPAGPQQIVQARPQKHSLLGIDLRRHSDPQQSPTPRLHALTSPTQRKRQRHGDRRGRDRNEHERQLLLKQCGRVVRESGELPARVVQQSHDRRSVCRACPGHAAGRVAAR